MKENKNCVRLTEYKYMVKDNGNTKPNGEWYYTNDLEYARKWLFVYAYEIFADYYTFMDGKLSVWDEYLAVCILNEVFGKKYENISKYEEDVKNGDLTFGEIEKRLLRYMLDEINEDGCTDMVPLSYSITKLRRKGRTIRNCRFAYVSDDYYPAVKDKDGKIITNEFYAAFEGYSEFIERDYERIVKTL